MEVKLQMKLAQQIEDLLRNHDFGEPWRLSTENIGIIVPILRKDIPQLRGYKILEEVKDKITIEDTGSIDQVKIRGNTDSPVFLRGGGVLEGKGTQSRAVQFGTVILPQKETIVPVLCVHASHGIRRTAFFSLKGYAPRRVAQALASRDQSRTWGAVTNYTRAASSSLSAIGARAPDTYFAQDDLARASETVERFRTDVEEALKKIPGDLENQVGVAIFDIQGVVGLEIFDHPESWHALSKSVMRQYSDVLVEQKTPDYLQINMEKVVSNLSAFLEKAKKGEEQEVLKNNGAKTTLIKGEIIGEYTLLNNRSIHLLLTRKEKEPTQPSGPLALGYSEVFRERRTPRTQETVEGTPSVLYTTVGPITPERIFKRRGSYEFLSSLADGPKTWKDLEQNTSFKSTNTLARRTKEALTLGLANKTIRLENGREIYKITPAGQDALKKAQKLYTK